MTCLLLSLVLPFGMMAWCVYAQINVGAVSPSELRAVSEKSLHLLAGTVADMEVRSL